MRMRVGSWSWQRSVLLAAVSLFLVWTATHLYLLTATQNGVLRFFLTSFFSLLILLRPKPRSGAAARKARPAALALAAAAGAGLAAAGIVFNVRQFEWLGLLWLLGACLVWALPPAYGPDTWRALGLAYWAHPLPGRLFEPLQQAMQTLSVRGSEWLLQLFNVRVWADGFVLRTGFNTFDVPEWCSGMRAATTVFLLTLGLGVLNRLAWYEILGLLPLALAQALALNVLRIAALVLFAPQGGPSAAAEFLHGAGAVVVLSAVGLLYLEVAAWRGWRERRAAAREALGAGLTAVLTERPLFWRRLWRYAPAAAAALAALLGAAAVAYRSRPYHRLCMIRDVALALRDNGRLEEAARAARLVREAFPDDEEWRLIEIRLMLQRNQYAEALAALRQVRADTPGQQTQNDILRAYALMGLQRLPEAAQIVQGLPEELKRREPRVAIILAEWGYYADDPEMTAEFVVPAARWRPNDARVRALFPYLRMHQKWRAIVAADSRAPYADPVQAYAAMEAYMNENRSAELAELVVQAEERWPQDLRLLEPLFFLAARRGRGEWEQRFAAHLRRALAAAAQPDPLCRLFSRCFELVRPDLAWQVHRRVAELDPAHPGLALAAVRYGPVWFSFRRRQLGLNAATEEERIDLRPFYAVGRALPPFQAVCAAVPYGAELCATNTAPVRRRLLAEALAEFETRDRAERLALEMQYEYVSALELAEQPERAREQLRRIAERYPERSTANRVFLSEIYERQGDWQNVYETLRGYGETSEPQPAALLRLGRAQLKLRLGLAAVHTARAAAARFPESSLAAVLLAEALLRFDSAEEALQVIERPRAWHQRELDLLKVECLRATQRFREAESFCRAELIPSPPPPPAEEQRTAPPPAELAALWHHVYTPSSREFERNAAVLRENLATATSPFLRELIRLWLAAYEARCAGDTAAPARWAAAGRDRFEKAALLNQLCLLLCWQDRLEAARAAAAQAVQSFPEAPALWRWLISLSGAAAETIARAREACPADAEIWLADLVRQTQPEGGSGAAAPPAEGAREAAALASVRRAQADGLAPAAAARAADYLLRAGLPRAAAAAARAATERAQGWLPAYVVGVRCALKEQDRDWAIACAREAIRASLNPPAFFYQKLVDLKSSQQPLPIDSDMVFALRKLREAEPDNPLWMQMLGYVCYQRGGVEMIYALYEMSAAIEGGVSNSAPYLIAAEASRFLGNYERARDLLRRGLERFPDDLTLHNNLTYLLALEPQTAAEALERLPTLRARAGEHPEVRDTIAVVCLRAGLLEQAEEELQTILRTAELGGAMWFRARLHQAEISLQRGEKQRARLLIEEALRLGKGIPQEDVHAANKIFSDLMGPDRRAPDWRTVIPPSGPEAAAPAPNAPP